MAAPDKVKKLVDDFERLKGGPPPDSFDEAQLGTSYLEPFWGALGWAVRDPREVVKEKRVHLRASTKHADYCFQLARKPQFIVEAKDYRKRLDDADFVFQTKRYGYNLPVDFGVLTNFDRFRLFDTGLEPVYENAARGLFKKFDLRYTDYEERWDELAAVFSREAVAAGALRELLPKARRTRNKEALDRKFFERLNEWRTELARVIALRNPDLSVHEINEAVQRILDRAIFMRVIEDRGIESTEHLADALTRWGREKEKPLYRYVVDKFRYLDPQYNGELFEKHFSETLLVDDKPLHDFIESLYYPKCPYQFNVVGVEMLGTIYERFLGSTIRLTESHRAKVEEKPEVRKAGGVYYTPRYIVDYIVENTVGELLKKCKTPAAVAKLKILDPACGSGSFLLGAFRRLIDWHEDYFTANPDKIGKGLAAACWRDADEEKYRLTARFKGQILVNNIFGVDIDPQACEVTRMSLYLKVLENVNAQYLIKTALLPPLDANIKCGNSLIGSDYWDFVREKQGELFERTPEEERRVNTFDWEVEFEAIMKAGGFDAVIGNPPWVMAGYYMEKELVFLKKKYETAEGKFDLYYIFIEIAVELLEHKGYFGMIVPNKFFHTRAARNLRSFLTEGRYIVGVVDFGYEKVFAGATNYSCILTLKKTPSKEVKFSKVNADLNCEEEFSVSWSSLTEKPWYFESPMVKELFSKIETNNVALSDLTSRFGTGVQTGADKLLVLDRKSIGPLGVESDIFTPVFRGRDVRRYCVNNEPKLLLFPYKKNGEFRIYSEVDLHSLFPEVHGYLKANKDKLAKRIWFDKTATDLSGKWFGMMYLDSLSSFERPHILTPSLSDKSNFALGKGTLFVTGTAGVTSVIPKEIPEDINYLLGVLNSSLISLYAIRHSPVFQGGYYKFSAPYLKKIPIRRIDFSDAADVERHDKMVALVEEMLELHKRLAAAKSDADKKRIQRAVDATDRKIDALVYELYGLNDEEINIVEGS